MKQINLLFIICLLTFGLNAQNVGIGTNSPASKLHVNGATTTGIEEDDENTGIQISNGNGQNAVIYINDAGDIEIRKIADSEVLTITSSNATSPQSVGIGTKTPDAKLHVAQGDLKVDNLSGAGTRMVIADTDGVLSTQAIPSGGGASDWGTLANIPADFADNTDNVDDADASVSNETITAGTLNGTDLEITEAGVTTIVDLSSLKDADWKKTDGTDATTITDNIYTNGNVGVGTSSVANGSLNVQSNNQEGYGYKSHVVYEDSDGTDPLNIIYASKTVSNADIDGVWYDLNVGARISVVNFCIQATGTNDAIAGQFSTSWNTAINHHVNVLTRMNGGEVTETGSNTILVDFGGAGSSLGTDLVLEIRINSGTNFINVRKVSGSHTGNVKFAFHVTRFFD